MSSFTQKENFMAIYNRIYNKDKWDQVSKYNKDLLENYMLQIRAEGKSPSSQKQYYNDARIILIYILEELDNKPLYKLNRKSFRNMVLWMQDNGLSPARINRMLSTCRNLLNFGLDDDDFLDDFEDCKVSPSRIKGIQKEKVREIIFLSDEEINIIIDELIEKKKFQQALLFALAYDSGSRRKELFQLKRYDIDLESNICKSKVRGKRGKMYRPIYNDLTKKVYRLYEESRTDTSDYLWITTAADGSIKPASYEALYSWVISARKILKDKLGIEKDFNPHSLRHSAADNLENGSHYICKKVGRSFTIMEIQKLLNHSDLSTTQGYLADRSEEELLSTFCV